MILIIQQGVMKQQKSRGRIHKMILQLRQKSHRREFDQLQPQIDNLEVEATVSGTTSIQNSQTFSQGQGQTEVSKINEVHELGQQKVHNFPNTIFSESLGLQKQESESYRREIKSAKPVFRRKITSKDKYSKTATQKQQIFKIDFKKSEAFQQLQILDSEYFIQQKNYQGVKQTSFEQQKVGIIKAFWAKQHIFVSLFPIQYTECIVYRHPNILPVYGQLRLRDKRYVVSNEYKHSSLKGLIKQFGPFQQNLCRNYLYQIVCGLQQMHNKKTAHNRLCSQNILYNKQGQIFINVVKSTSRPLAEKQKQQRLFQYCPQIILSKNKSNSLRSDIWSVGITLLDMLFNFGSFNAKCLNFHPYNWSENKLTQNNSIIVDNLKQLYPKNFQAKSHKQIKPKIDAKYNKLTQQCKDLIQKCLILNRQDRPNIKAIKTHRFFIR